MFIDAVAAAAIINDTIYYYARKQSQCLYMAL